MNLGALLALVKLAQDAGLTKVVKTKQEIYGKYYTETGAISRAEEGLGL